ncbi:hypothetical protein H9Q72_006309 [Fusarium xylarioides]|uniref:Major facilitator superfamily (MFS) profile domain-containing protein n=1 Tax=Fusarium xylarioides TaxID=221167 RepID=A0A9P7L1M3_9HYPO|nr:hypothetical protein H9Q72_006309 [Fusarium xylarioides]
MNSTTPLLSANRVPTSYSNLTEFPPLVIRNGRRRRGTKKSLRTKIQIPLLCYARLMVAMAYFSIFPHVALMIQHNSGSRATDIGAYVGFFEVLFLAAQALTSIFWVTMADKFGGKTILICVLLGTTISSAIFGFSSSLWQMALCRCFMGMVSGGDVAVHTMIGKRCMTETEASAYPPLLETLEWPLDFLSAMLLSVISINTQLSSKPFLFLGNIRFASRELQLAS